jgi:hypothetical protein
MDRVNRSFLVTSTLLAIPAALLMASLSTGTTPEIERAVGHGNEAGGVHQVAEKRPSSNRTRPGLFQVFSGSKTQGSHNHQHSNMPKNEPKGLLDGLFDRATRSIPFTSNKAADELPLEVPPPPANWDGVPYHRGATTSRNSASSAEPIRDPSERHESGSPQVVRNGPRPIPAKSVSARRPSDPKLTRLPTGQLSVPMPPAEVAPLASSKQSFSTGTSSRRSGRKSLDTLDTSKVAEKPKEVKPKAVKPKAVNSKVTDQPAAEQDDEDSLIPRVARKVASPIEKKVQPKVTAKPATADVARKEQQVKTPSNSPKKNTAIASIGAPKLSKPEPKSSNDVISLAPATAAPAKVYSTPVDPATTPMPIVSRPRVPIIRGPPMPISSGRTHPYAASTPASHRAGPPSAAFGPGQISNLPSQTGQQPHGRAQFNAASTPVGSGIVPNGDVNSFRQSGTQPAFEVARSPNYPKHASQGVPRAGHLPTQGQPVASQRAPAGETATVPMYSINGLTAPQQTASNPTAADNFDRSSFDSRNQMRDDAPSSNVVASELPGIRVITQGPNSIMTRQTSTYEIRVENRGSIDAEGVLVRALLPDWAEIRGQNASRGDIENQTQGSTERLVWTIDHVPAGGSERMFLRLTAARSGTYDLDVDWTLVPQKSVAKIQVREPRLDLTIDGPDEVVYGQSQTYTVRVLNPGDGTAPNVVFTLSPNSATPQTQRIGDIPPGKEAQFDVELTAQDLGDLKIHGLASGDLELRAESSKTIRVSTAELEAVLTGPELKYQHVEAMYSLQVQNAGSATSEKIGATLRIPAGVKYLGGIDQAVVQGDALKWEINALAPGASRDYQFRCGMATTGEHVFAFDCVGSAAGNANVMIATNVESIADLVLSVNDPAAPAPVGSEVIYEILIRNRGSKEASNVQVVSQFSHGIEPQRVEGQSGKMSTGQVAFDEIPRIGAGKEVRIKVVATAESAGHHRFRTEVRSGDTVLVAEEATHYMSSQSERVSRRSSSTENR